MRNCFFLKGLLVLNLLLFESALKAQVPAPGNLTGSPDVDKNWIKSRALDETGAVITETKQFFDDEGKVTQAQAKVNVKVNGVNYTHVLASQVLYDELGRPALSTLPAPINYADFKYQPNFISKSGSPYSYKNYDRYYTGTGYDVSKINNPDLPDNATVGTLGWYYSTNNTWEPYTATTSYPFARTSFYSDGTGKTKKAAGAGEAFRMGSGHETGAFTTPVISELDHYLQVRNKYFTATELGGLPTTLKYLATQAGQNDANGKEAISIMDRDGKVLMSARPGTDLTIQNSVTLNPAYRFSFQGTAVGQYAKSLTVSGGTIKVWSGTSSSPYGTVLYSGPASGYSSGSSNLTAFYTIESANFFSVSYSSVSGYIESTICSGCPAEANTPSAHYFKLFSPTTVTISAGFTLYDVNAEQTVSFTSGGTLAAGYYQVINNTVDPITITYSNGYTDVSYNFYNQVGQLVATISPEGVKKLFGTGINNYTTKNDVPFMSLNEYDVRGRLIKTIETDEGATEFIYRKDGKLRFLQNEQQKSSGKFSYINYDQYGRHIESGEFKPNTGTVTRIGAENFAAMSGVSKQPTQDDGGGYHLGNIALGDYADYSYTAPTAGTYAVNLRLATPNTGAQLQLQLTDGTVLATVNVPVTGNWQSFLTTKTTVTLAAGAQTIRVKSTASPGWNFNWMELVAPLSGALSFDGLKTDYTTMEDVSPTGGLVNGTKSFVLKTTYDAEDYSFKNASLRPELESFTQTFTRGRISVTEKLEDGVTTTSKTWLSYDEQGRAVWVIKYISGLGYKTTENTFDALGKLTKNVYQKGIAAETFVHYYEYDANQRVSKIYTNTVDNVATRSLQAYYQYYLHGPLKRVELAGNLQGIDYTYTLQGQLKAINNSDKTKDPGQDGTTFLPDAFGEVLDYYNNDYLNGRTGVQPIKGVNTTGIATDSYTGQIKAMSWYSKKPTSVVSGNPNAENPTAYVYKYDSKYQFVESVWGTSLNFTTTPASFTTTSFNKETVYTPGTSTPAYDANGNIRFLQRTDRTGATADKLTYNYYNTQTFAASNTNYNTNQLQSVVEDIPSGPVTTHIEAESWVAQSGILAQNTADVGGGMNVGYIDIGNYFDYAYTAPVAGTYAVSLRVASPNVGAQLQIQKTDGTVLATVDVPTTGDFQTWQTVTTSITLAAGAQTLRIKSAADPHWNINWWELTSPSGGGPQLYAQYTYDETGQLTSEVPVDATKKKYVKYNASGKIVAVARDPAFTQKVVEYVYDELGQRIIKKNYNASYQLAQLTFYVGDVIYTQPVTGGTSYGAITAQEYELDNGMGGRLGVYFRPANIYAYALTDHLGNTRAVVAKSGTTLDIRAYTDYYPYGMVISEYKSAEGYRYGFQGQYSEKDGETDWNAFELRMYDSRIGRWLSGDPEGEFWSPYVAMGNDPIASTDATGGGTGDGEDDPIQPNVTLDPVTVTSNGFTRMSLGAWRAWYDVQREKFSDEQIEKFLSTQNLSSDAWQKLGYAQKGYAYRQAVDRWDDQVRPVVKFLVIQGATTLVGGVAAKLLFKGIGWAYTAYKARNAIQTVETTLALAEETTIVAKEVEGTYSVYHGVENGVVKYVGITSRNPAIRFAEHEASGGAKSLLDFEVIEGGLTKIEARIMEQNLINQYGLPNLYNKINSIAPTKWAQFGIAY